MQDELSNLENKLNEETAKGIDNIFNSEPEGIKASEITGSTYEHRDLSEVRKEAKNTIKKAEWTPSKPLQEELMKTIKDESEASYYTEIKDPELKKEKRKLASYTLGLDTISKIKELSKDKRMNQSRFVEMLVEQYEENEALAKAEHMTLLNSAGPIDLNLLELATKVARIIESKNLIKTS